jgi:hypothetical protein
MHCPRISTTKIKSMVVKLTKAFAFVQWDANNRVHFMQNVC